MFGRRCINFNMLYSIQTVITDKQMKRVEGQNNNIYK